MFVYIEIASAVNNLAVGGRLREMMSSLSDLLSLMTVGMNLD
jgi:hypothetical protein